MKIFSSMQPHTKKFSTYQTTPYLLGVLVMLMWSTTFASTKILLRSFSPEAIMLFRFTIAWLFLFCLKPQRIRITSWRDEALFFLLALTGCTLYFFTENSALRYADSVSVGLLVTTAPILTIWVAQLFRQTPRTTLWQWLGSFISFLGVALVSFNGHLSFALSTKGAVLALLAALMWAFYSVLVKYVGQNYSSITITRKIFFYALVSLTPLLLIRKTTIEWRLLLLPINYLNTLFLGLFASGVAYIIWSIVVKRMGAIKANNFIYLQPLMFVLIGYFVLNESITGWKIGGGLLILFGLYMGEQMQRKKRQKK